MGPSGDAKLNRHLVFKVGGLRDNKEGRTFQEEGGNPQEHRGLTRQGQRGVERCPAWLGAARTLSEGVGRKWLGKVAGLSVTVLGLQQEVSTNPVVFFFF